MVLTAIECRKIEFIYHHTNGNLISFTESTTKSGLKAKRPRFSFLLMPQGSFLFGLQDK